MTVRIVVHKYEGKSHKRCHATFARVPAIGECIRLGEERLRVEDVEHLTCGVYSLASEPMAIIWVWPAAHRDDEA
ncbi:MAG: hypothetical protein EPN91_08370 [Salinibacterium sp.]|nr:MAG: hypothetical protein EPN91_08370 [Salinibacterium sp.]